MSELTPCNFCEVAELRRRYGDEAVELRPETFGGQWPNGVDVMVNDTWNRWCAEVGDHCEC
jgi:hypothetical protein